MKIIITKRAQRQLIEAARFYELQGDDLGTYFLDSLYADIDALYRCAGVHRVFYHRYYRMIARHFPFAIYYRIVKTTIRIHAVIDCRRHPSWIRKHLEG